METESIQNPGVGTETQAFWGQGRKSQFNRFRFKNLFIF